MSYRAFKRVLGETSLERKCRVLFGICMLLLITGSFWWYGRQTELLVDSAAEQTGRQLVDMSLVLVHWDFWETNEKSNSYVQDLSKRLQDNQDYSWSFLRAIGLDEKNQPLSAESRQILAMFQGKDAPETFRRVLPGGDKYEFFKPITASAECIDCHRVIRKATNVNTGDLLAVARVEIARGNTQFALNWNRAVLLSTGIITVFLAMVASYVIVRYVIVKPLKHLRDVSDAVSQGDLEQRAEIHTGDEFEDLAVAFNRMLRHLVSAQGELRQVNQELDGKVDQLARMNMRLWEMNRLKGDFLATMSHELRTPLNSIIGFSDVLCSIDSLDDKQKRYVKNIQKSGRMLLDMINDILDLAKAEAGKMELRVSDFRIDRVVHAQCDLARPLAERKNIDIDVEIDPTLPELRQDAAKVQQVLNNLLTNAIKFTPEGGRIRVQAARNGKDDLLLIVSDTGVGIAEEDQVRIFEKFRQGNIVMPDGDAMTREFSGTGLGLSLVKEYCKLLGGEIGLKSELGTGSTFTVRIPFILPEPASEDVNGTNGGPAELAKLRLPV